MSRIGRQSVARVSWRLVGVLTVCTANAHGPAYVVPVVPAADVPADIRVTGPLPAADSGVNDLKFKDIFTQPAGPRGLVPTASFLALDGKRVRMVGYMIALNPPTADAFMFAPLPAAIAAHDEGLADDIPPATIYVRLPRFSSMPGATSVGIPQAQGLLTLTGTLDVVAYADAVTGRVFPASLTLDPGPRRAVLRLAAMATPAPATSTKAPPAVLAGARR